MELAQKNTEGFAFDCLQNTDAVARKANNLLSGAAPQICCSLPNAQ